MQLLKVFFSEPNKLKARFRKQKAFSASFDEI
jgi:hypothetical protein